MGETGHSRSGDGEEIYKPRGRNLHSRGPTICRNRQNSRSFAALRVCDFLMSSKIRCDKQNSCDDKLATNAKKSQTLRMTRVEGFSLTSGLDSRGRLSLSQARLSLHFGRGRSSLHQHIYAITGLAAATGSTRSVSPSTWRTRMRSPAGAGSAE